MLLNCGHYATPDNFWPGYALLDGYTLCQPCTHADQLAQMKFAAKIVAYLSADREVTTWLGDRLGRVVRREVCRGAARQLRVWVTDLHGQHWYGTGPTMTGNYLNLRKLAGNGR